MRPKAPFFIFLFLFLVGFAGQSTLSHAQFVLTAQQQKTFEVEGAKEFARGAYRRARVYYERLARARPAMDRYWISYGSALYNAGETERAIAAYRRAIRLKGPLRMVAALYLAECYRQEQKTHIAREIVFWLLRQEDLPQNFLQEVLLVYDLIEDSSQPESEYEELIRKGVSAYRRGKIKDAKNLFDGAITVRRSEEALLLYGFTLFRLDRFEEAKIVLRELSGETKDRTIKATIDQFLKELEIDRRTKLWLWSRFDFEFEHTAFPEYSTDSASFVPEASLGYRFWEMESWQLVGSFRLKWQQLLSPTSDTLIHNHLGGKIAYFGERWQATGELFASLSQFADEAFLFRITSGLSLARRFRESLLSLSLYGVASSGLSDPYSYLTGPTTMAKLDWTFLFSSGSWSLWTSYAIDEIDDSVIGATRVPVANKYARFGTLTEFGIGSDFVGRTSHSIGRKNFRDPVNPGGQAREDIVYEAIFGFGYRGRSKVSADLDFHYNVNNSNITSDNVSDQRFREKLYTLKIFWDINP